jgi:hypothetical protein
MDYFLERIAWNGMDRLDRHHLGVLSDVPDIAMWELGRLANRQGRWAALSWRQRNHLHKIACRKCGVRYEPLAS